MRKRPRPTRHQLMQQASRSQDAGLPEGNGRAVRLAQAEVQLDEMELQGLTIALISAPVDIACDTCKTGRAIIKMVKYRTIPSRVCFDCTEHYGWKNNVLAMINRQHPRLRHRLLPESYQIQQLTLNL